MECLYPAQLPTHNKHSFMLSAGAARWDWASAALNLKKKKLYTFKPWLEPLIRFYTLSWHTNQKYLWNALIIYKLVVTCTMRHVSSPSNLIVNVEFISFPVLSSRRLARVRVPVACESKAVLFYFLWSDRSAWESSLCDQQVQTHSISPCWHTV